MILVEGGRPIIKVPDLIVILRACVDPLHFLMHPRQKQWSQ